jgi:hypothetical protein
MRLLLLMILAGMTPIIAEGGDANALATAEDLKRELGDIDAKVRAWYVEYEDVEAKQLGGPRFYHHCVAAVGPNHELYEYASHGSPYCDWRNDPFQQRVIINGTSVVGEHPFARVFARSELATDAPLPGTAAQSPVFMVLGWWGLGKRPVPGPVGTPLTFQAIARSPGYKVGAVQECINGRWCHILEYSGHDRLWLDRERGCALVKREILDPATGFVLRRVTATGHFMVASGVWAPRSFKYELFGPPEKTARQGASQPYADFRMEVLSVKVNEEVPSNLFVFSPEAGSVEQSGNGRFHQVAPGGSDYLDFLAKWAKDRSVGGAAAVPIEPTGNEPALEYGLISLCLLCLVISRRRRVQHRFLAPLTGK